MSEPQLTLEEERIRQVALVTKNPEKAATALRNAVFRIYQAITASKLDRDDHVMDHLLEAQKVIEDFLEAHKSPEKKSVELSELELGLVIRSLQDLRLPIKQELDLLHANYNNLTPGDAARFNELEQQLKERKDLEERLRLKLKEMR